jgi:hypothetical protein
MKSMKTCLKFLPVIVGCLMLTACCSVRPPRQDEVNLKPPDARPVFSIVVEDADEIAILKQQLKIEPVQTIGPTLYFAGDERIAEKLKSLGYMPAAADPYQVYNRVIRVYHKGREEELLKTGVKFINREKDFLVVRGSLAQLTSIRQMGYRIANAGPAELRPREVRVRVFSKEDVAYIGTIQVDIFTAQETREGIVVYGRAFDYQIDLMREKDFKVEIIDTIKKGGEK